MGWTTIGKPTNRRTYMVREDAERGMEEFLEEHEEWDKTDYVNRAMMYYKWLWDNGELNDPKVGDREDSL